ncbi:hypothetical protein [Paenibacillus donghaensis]|uniref:Uncharacterized protein n=1 Tax=Paenibacillus donghaensis TaxID=414771 RepID=A0A2Z2KAG5_9BACL|nr:hypothetical protein [Paenibacillus donghaensis]ASA22584.1 hypothetical protein B9T62_18430 [Paenibacillus donghaensis]
MEILKHKKDGRFGTLEYSMFGGSVHWYDENNVFCKSLGDRKENILSRWDIIDELPEGYEIGEWGGVKKIKQ